jgi:FdhD protein
MGRVTDRRRVVRIGWRAAGGAGPGGAGPGGAGPGGAGPGGAGAAGAGEAAGTGAAAGGGPAGGGPASGTGAAGGRGGSSRQVRRDTLVAEELLEIRVGRAGQPRPPLAVTMRTPGDDLDLALGFLITEGVIGSAADVRAARLCAGTDQPNTYNVVDVTLAPEVPPPATDPSRHFYTTSSCGVCGKASIDAVRTRSRYRVAEDPVRVRAEILVSLPDRLRSAQRVFARTGGLHAAGLFTAAGEPVALREDVGRHNAVDKVIGWAAREGRLPLRGQVLLVSGRASFELTQKAWMAGVPLLAAVSAPSTLAVSLAEEAGMTLVGFLRGATMNIYAGDHRVT